MVEHSRDPDSVDNNQNAPSRIVSGTKLHQPASSADSGQAHSNRPGMSESASGSSRGTRSKPESSAMRRPSLPTLHPALRSVNTILGNIGAQLSRVLQLIAPYTDLLPVVVAFVTLVICWRKRDKLRRNWFGNVLLTWIENLFRTVGMGVNLHVV